MFPYVGGERVRRGAAATRPAGAGTSSNTAYRLRLPASTEQILHPDAYFDADEPKPVRIGAGAVLGDGWTRAAAGTWGELQTRELLALGGGARAAAAGWGGDRYELWRSRRSATAVRWSMRWRWDTPARRGASSPRALREWAQSWPAQPHAGGRPRGRRDAGGRPDDGAVAHGWLAGVRDRPDLDRRALAVLGAGHLCVDLCQGAVPALLPFLAAERGYSYAALGALVLFSTIGSSIIQPRSGSSPTAFARPWLMPGGLALAAVGIALAGPAPSYGLTAVAVVVSGLGVAAFHPGGGEVRRAWLARAAGEGHEPVLGRRQRRVRARPAAHDAAGARCSGCPARSRSSVLPLDAQRS